MRGSECGFDDMTMGVLGKQFGIAINDWHRCTMIGVDVHDWYRKTVHFAKWFISQVENYICSGKSFMHNA